MDIYEKAKAYDNAIENMRKFRNALNNHEELDLWVLKKEIVTDIEYYFPELKESEDGENKRISKEITQFLKQNNGWNREWLAWLEKQGEQTKIEALRTEYEKGRADTLSEMKSSWSEEDEKTLNEIFSVAARASLRKSTLFGKSYDYIKWQNWLKSLRDRVQPQPKQEWSEEDEHLSYWTIHNLTELKNRFGENYGDSGKCIDWIKQLKQRIGWKPSDEQIKVCKEVYADLLSAKGFNICTVNNELNRLEKQLKKLTE